MFLLSRASEIKDLPIQRTYNRADLDKHFVLFTSEQHFFMKLFFTLSKDLKQL